MISQGLGSKGKRGKTEREVSQANWLYICEWFAYLAFVMHFRASGQGKRMEEGEEREEKECVHLGEGKTGLFMTAKREKSTARLTGSRGKNIRSY